MKNLFELKDLITGQIRDLYDAEMQYGNLLPGLIRTATASDLDGQLQEIARQTWQNAARLALICGLLGVPSGVHCKVMQGLIGEVRDTTQEWGDTPTIDAALIAQARRMVHYEIAGFGTARAMAYCIGEKEVAYILDELLKQAFENDSALTRIATEGWISAGIHDEAAKAVA